MRALCVFGTLLAAKIAACAGHPLPPSPWTPAALLWQDAMVALLFAVVDACSRRAWIGWSLYGGIAAYTAVNAGVMRVLSTPITWPMLRATRGTLADSITLYFSWEHLRWILLVLACAAVLPFVLRKAPRWTMRVALGLGIALVAAGPYAASRVSTNGLDRNALAVLAIDAFPRIRPRSASEDWRKSPYPAEELDDPVSDGLARLRGSARGRNVVLVLLESAGARYLSPYGAAEDPMPTLTELARTAVLFENAYCVYPESIKGLFSVLCSLYPALDTKAEDHGPGAGPSIASVLSGAGYKTRLFHSGRFFYLGMESIVRGRGFDAVEDAGDIGGNRSSSFGIDEPSAVRRILAWIDGLTAGDRFFVTYLPVAGHHPYDTPEKGPFPEREEVGRYRNALRYGDAAVRQLLDGLKERGHRDDTLFLFMGDHGEAFHQHPENYGHTFFIYEENVRVPFLIFAPGIVKEPLRVRRTASLIDAAPTILDLLGIEAPATWQGNSALDREPRLALFFTDYSLALLGLRDESWKSIHDVRAGKSRLFDLSLDPGETVDISEKHPERAKAYDKRLLDWAAAQRANLQKRLPGKP